MAQSLNNHLIVGLQTLKKKKIHPHEIEDLYSASRVKSSFSKGPLDTIRTVQSPSAPHCTS